MIVTPDMFSQVRMIQKCVGSRRSAPDPAWELTALTHALNEKGYGKGKAGERREGKEGRGGGNRRKGTDGKGIQGWEGSREGKGGQGRGTAEERGKGGKEGCGSQLQFLSGAYVGGYRSFPNGCMTVHN